MAAIPPSMTRPLHAETAKAAADGKWSALHDTATTLATMAGVEPGPETAVLDFAAMMRNATPWQRALSDRGLDDVAVALRPGLLALLEIEERGGDPARAARGLWREFAEARAAILALSPLASA